MLLLVCQQMKSLLPGLFLPPWKFPHRSHVGRGFHGQVPAFIRNTRRPWKLFYCELPLQLKYTLSHSEVLVGALCVMKHTFGTLITVTKHTTSFRIPSRQSSARHWTLSLPFSLSFPPSLFPTHGFRNPHKSVADTLFHPHQPRLCLCGHLHSPASPLLCVCVCVCVCLCVCVVWSLPY